MISSKILRVTALYSNAGGLCRDAGETSGSSWPADTGPDTPGLAYAQWEGAWIIKVLEEKNCKSEEEVNF